MHMADALLSPAVGATFWAASLSGIAYSARKLKNQVDEKLVPLMGVLGAFVFAAQMINFTIPATGSSGHLGGGMLLSIILGPYAAFIVMASILTIQALFFADGGLLALGCNIWNLGFYTCFVAYPLIFKPIYKRGDNKRLFIASLAAGIAGLQLGAFSVVIQTFFSGITELPFNTFVLLMQPIHLAIGIVEGFVTAAIVVFVKNMRPEIVENSVVNKPIPVGVSVKKVILILLALTVLTGGVLSWFASENPDGLEWSMEKTYGRPELPEKESAVLSILKSIQKKTAFLPDYNFKKQVNEAEEAKNKTEEVAGEEKSVVDPGTSFSGVIGSFIVLAVIFVTGFVIKSVKRLKSN